MSRIIKLSQGRHTIVDDEDYESLSQYHWYYHNGYAKRTIYTKAKTTVAFMHRQIMDTPKGLVCDHINGDGLDNRRINLRNCTQGENVTNKQIMKTNTSGVPGVCWDKQCKKWKARVSFKSRCYTIGVFKHFEDAVKARSEAVLKYQGEFAYASRKDLSSR